MTDEKRRSLTGQERDRIELDARILYAGYDNQKLCRYLGLLGDRPRSFTPEERRAILHEARMRIEHGRGPRQLHRGKLADVIRQPGEEGA